MYRKNGPKQKKHSASHFFLYISYFRSTCRIRTYGLGTS